MSAMTVADVYESFESSFQDKNIIPESLEHEWLKRAIAVYSVELEEISFDEETGEFSESADRYAIDILAALMKLFYQQREVSKVNKRVSIVSKDISIDGNNGSKTAAKNELDFDLERSIRMMFNRKPTAYS